jgi:hypothetical protein
MSFGFGVGDFFAVYDVFFRVKGFINDIRHAGEDFEMLKAEADCLKVCISALCYKECVAALALVSKEQRDDLKLIVQGCIINMKELQEFVTHSQALVEGTAKDANDPKPRRQLERRKWWKRWWPHVKFAWKEKQPLRDKLSIPTASLNIFLTTLIHMSLAQFTIVPRGMSIPASAGANSGHSINGLSGWNAVGSMTAFRSAHFNTHDLAQPGLEQEIVAYAITWSVAEALLPTGPPMWLAEWRPRQVPKARTLPQESRNVALVKTQVYVSCD